MTRPASYGPRPDGSPLDVPAVMERDRLQRLEDESVHIIREVAAQFRNPVMLYSIGKDSSVMLHLARKAFHPGRIPFPLLHVNHLEVPRDDLVRDRWPEMASSWVGHTNAEGWRRGINPFDQGRALNTDGLKTQALRPALNRGPLQTPAFEGRATRKPSRPRASSASATGTNRRTPRTAAPSCGTLQRAPAGG